MADIHVAPNGNDANPGTIASPKKTPSGAHSASSPGDTIHYHGGTYYILGQETLSVNGTSGNPITHKPYVSGGVIETVVFSGLSGTFGATDGLISVAGNFTTFDGIDWGYMTFRDNAVGRGIETDDDGIVKNCVFHDLGERSIGGGSHRVLVQHNHVYRGGMAHISGSPAAWPGGIAPFSLGTGVLSSSWIITGNYVHDHWGEGIITLRVTGCVVIGNIVHDCYSVGIYVDKCKSTIVDSNYVFYTNPGYNKSGAKMRLTNNANESLSIRCGNSETRYRNNILVGGSVAIKRFQDGANTSNQNYYSDWHIDNNLIWGQDDEAIQLDNVASPSPEPTGCYIRNNIFFTGTSAGANIDISSTDRNGWTWQNNIFANFTPPTYATGSNSFFNQNPGLINPVLSGSANGFALNYTSIANRAGIHIPAITLDYFGKTRNNPPTIGPYEIPAQPTGTNDFYTVNKNTVLVQASSPSGVFVNDYLGMSGVLHGYNSQSVQTGTVYISGSGAFTYTPATNFVGSDTFKYTVLGMGGTGSATVAVTVNEGFSAPVAVNDSYTTSKNVVYETGAAGGLFANDTLNSGTLDGYDAVTTRAGSVYVSGSGAFRYVPPTNEYGGVADTFRYTLINGVGTGTATVSIVINNVAPDANNDSFTTIKTAVFSTGGLFTNDVLNSGTLLGFDTTTTRGGTVYVTGNNSGTFIYTPPAGIYGGVADTFRYTLSNSVGTGTATVSITLINVLPIVVNDNYSTIMNVVYETGAAGGLFANDTLNSGTLSSYDAISNLEGAVYVSGSGAFKYIPPLDFYSGKIDTFKYVVSNNIGAVTGTVNMTVILNPPAPVNDTFTTIKTAVFSTGGLFTNDVLNSGTLLGYDAVTTRGGTAYVTGNNSGTFIYTPPAGVYGGAADTFRYTLSNSAGTGTATVSINLINMLPSAVNDNYTTSKNVVYETGSAGGLFANDTLNSGTLNGYDSTTIRGGSVYVSGSGAFKYTPPNNEYGGVADTFRYTLINDIGTGTATVSMTINNVAPAPVNDTFTTIKTAVFSSGGLFTNDVLNSGTLLGFDATTTRGGTAYVSGVGYFTYTPPAGVYGGVADTFRYTLSNSVGTGVATVSINLINVAPVVVEDSYNTIKDIVLTGVAPGVFTNDVLNSGTLHGYTSTTTLGGSVYLSGSGAFRYVPPLGIFSPPEDTFQYTVTNDVGSGTATVSVSIASDSIENASGTSSSVRGYYRYQAYWRYRKI